LDSALRCGYRSIDSATIYRNEEDIGLALEELCPLQGIKRSDLFLTSKLAPKDQGYDSCVSSVRKSLQNLRTDYLDLYLIHWPGAGGIKVDDPSNATRRLQSWKALEHCYQMGLVRAIGVSNYCIHHLQEMEAYAEINPHVLQVEHHPHYVQTALVEYCSRLGIHFQAYSSLGTTVDAQTNPLLNDELVGRLARRYAKTPAQVLLRWATQQEIGVLPKSLNPLHIAENIALDWDLAKEDVLELNRLEEKRKYAWDPSSVV